jgi:uncharacterized membrane protein
MEWLLNIFKGKWLGHPLHPILVHIPIATWLSALIFDVVSKGGYGGQAMVHLSFYAIVFGLAAVLLAVPTGVVDWMGIKRTNPAWKLGLYHMLLNALVALLFAINLALRWPTFRESQQVDTIPLLLSAVGALILLGSAYLGGRMVYEYGISVARMSKKKWRKLAEAGGANVPPE